MLIPSLHTLFNNILEAECFPAEWSSALIVPIHKKGVTTDPNNFRGISLMSWLCKLFTSILNKRLAKVYSDQEILTDAQFGFRSGLSTVDAIFALQYIISKPLSTKKKRLYCCFVDFRKAFDFVDRVSLWYKLIKLGIRGKFLKVIKGLY